MMQPNNQNADQHDYQNHALSGIGTLHNVGYVIYIYIIIIMQKQVHMETFDIS